MPILIAALFVSCATHDRSDIAASLERIIDRDGSDAVQISVKVVDLNSNRVLYERDSSLLMRPASTMKLLATSAMCRRAPGWAVETALEADALPAGRLTLVGGGDPMLTHDDLSRMVEELKKKGLRRVEGPLVIEDPLAGRPRFGVGWMWDDEPASFMPHLTGIPVQRACVTVLVERKGDELVVTTDPPSEFLELTVQHVPGADGISITRDWQGSGSRVVVAGDLAPGTTATRTISLPDPALVTAEDLKTLLMKAGLAQPDLVVVVRGPQKSPAGRSPAARAVTRRGLLEMLLRVNKPSDNLAAELLLRHLPHSNELPGRRPMGTDREGLQVVSAQIATLGLDPKGYRLADGSGVSHYNLISADLLVRLLRFMSSRGGAGFQLFRTSLPIAGEDGTLQGRMRGTAAEGRVRAKTGTISGVSCLAGYIETETGRQLAFAILVQNFVGSSLRWRRLQDSLCASLASL